LSLYGFGPLSVWAEAPFTDPSGSFFIF
jgi:hypothetical protein